MSKTNNMNIIKIPFKGYYLGLEDPKKKLIQLLVDEFQISRRTAYHWLNTGKVPKYARKSINKLIGKSFIYEN
jgi:hypothetical protein